MLTTAIEKKTNLNEHLDCRKPTSFNCQSILFIGSEKVEEVVEGDDDHLRVQY